MTETKLTILIVDDEPYNVRILERLLQENNCTTVTAENGAVAWEYLKKHPRKIDIILLDRMMPVMDGMELLRLIKEHPELQNIPVIMQTAAAETQQVIEGIEAGVYYYLTKPFEETMLLSIINTARADAEEAKQLKSELQKQKTVIGLITMAQFKLHTLPEAYNLSYFLANYFPNPERAVVGLYALMVNAIEHGNLGISYEEKTQLMQKRTWHKEVARRLALPENANKLVEVRYGQDNDQIKVYIKDDGKGFNWRAYMRMDPKRATHTHGRGIAMANRYSFDLVEYLGKGNEVLCTVKLKQPQAVAK